jgi:hypothetical protein
VNLRSQVLVVNNLLILIYRNLLPAFYPEPKTTGTKLAIFIVTKEQFDELWFYVMQEKRTTMSGSVR